MRHLDLFSGIGGFALAASWVWGDEYENVGHSEIEKYACKVYHRHFKSECLGDITKIAFKEGGADLVTGGWPCQDNSIAGKRLGHRGERSGLFFELGRCLGVVKPSWFVFENVPGLLSVRQGEEMAEVLGTLSEIGYCVVWRVLDAQYFGVAQKRRRVWIVGSLGNSRSVQVLFEQEGSSGDDSQIKEVGPRGLCISTRDGEWADPTNETLVTFSIGTTDFTGATGSRSRNIIGHTIGTNQRGNAGRIWEDTHIAEVNPTRKREVNGVSPKLDSARGKCLGNAIVPQCAEWIMRRIRGVAANS